MNGLETQIGLDIHRTSKEGYHSPFYKRISREILPAIWANDYKVSEEATKLGQLLMSWESTFNTKKTEKKNQPIVLGNLSHEELLGISRTIEVNGTNLLNIFDNKLISENGLRRLVYEFASSGDISEQLQQEIFEHDLDFEKDPRLRGYRTTTPDQLNASTSYDDFLGKANSLIDDPDQSDNYLNIDDQETSDRFQLINHLKLALNPIDLVFISVIILLTLSIIIIYLSKH